MNLKSIIGGESVDSILAQFETQRGKLQALAGKLREAAEKQKTEADALLEQSKAKGAEANRALRVATKIGELID